MIHVTCKIIFGAAGTQRVVSVTSAKTCLVKRFWDRRDCERDTDNVNGAGRILDAMVETIQSCREFHSEAWCTSKFGGYSAMRISEQPGLCGNEGRSGHD
ncbi:hypothetical protein N7501_003247 [Penicillium viridicatum]|nr:hypothetical protein N7501_003247 [Penicillium viridicatum]